MTKHLAALTTMAVIAGLGLGCEQARSDAKKPRARRAAPVMGTARPAAAAAAKPTAATMPNDTSAAPREVAILAGGCFWGMEQVLRGAPGIVSIEVGYAGGPSTNVSYEDVSSGTTGHAESVRIVFDPRTLSYEDLLLRYFRGHDPTQLDHQNNDLGTQYRSEIFTTTDAQRRTALAVKARVDGSHAWKRPIVTRIEPATTWVRAEEYHQDFLLKHPDGYNDHYLRDLTF